MQLWQDFAKRAGLELSQDRCDLLSRYIDLLLEANQKLNLTRIDSRDAAEKGHIADALTLLAYLPAGEIGIADVGTGGGVPGIPLAIARPDARVTLVEATRKKAIAVQAMVDALGLTGVSVVNQRAEEVGRSSLRQSFDVAVVRAVGPMVWIAEWCLPLVKKGGCVLAMKGPRVTQELVEAKKAIRWMGGAEPVVHPVELDGFDGHVIVEIKKKSPTDERYPRLASVAKGRPI